MQKCFENICSKKIDACTSRVELGIGFKLIFERCDLRFCPAQLQFWQDEVCRFDLRLNQVEEIRQRTGLKKTRDLRLVLNSGVKLYLFMRGKIEKRSVLS